MFLIGVLIFLVCAWLEMMICVNFQAGSALVFIDIPSIVAIIIPIASVIVATGEYRTFVMGLNAVFSKKYSISAADKEKAIKLFRLLGKTVIYAAFFATVIPGISILIQLSDVQYIGPNIAVMLITALYAAFINLILINPAIYILEKRYIAEEKRVISEKEVINKLLEMCYIQGISPEEIIEANEISFKK